MLILQWSDQNTFPAPVLSVSGSKGMISARSVRHPIVWGKGKEMFIDY